MKSSSGRCLIRGRDRGRKVSFAFASPFARARPRRTRRGPSSKRIAPARECTPCSWSYQLAGSKHPSSGPIGRRVPCVLRGKQHEKRVCATWSLRTRTRARDDRFRGGVGMSHVEILHSKCTSGPPTLETKGRRIRLLQWKADERLQGILPPLYVEFGPGRRVLQSYRDPSPLRRRRKSWITTSWLGHQRRLKGALLGLESIWMHQELACKVTSCHRISF